MKLVQGHVKDDQSSVCVCVCVCVCSGEIRRAYQDVAVHTVC